MAIDLKKPACPRAAFDENLTHSKQQFPALVWFNALLIASNRAARKAAKVLLERLKALLVLNRRQKSTARSQLKLAIEDVLDKGLPRAYSPGLYQQKCPAVFEPVNESYPERDAGMYASAA